MIKTVVECGSGYLQQVNAFYVREFQMMHAAEDAARFLHHACMGLPLRQNGQNSNESSTPDTLDGFYAAMVEHAVAFFGSRVLYPSRPCPDAPAAIPLSRSAY